jgi:hypothetical protein
MHLGLQKFLGKWTPHELPDDQKRLWFGISEAVVDVLRNNESAQFLHVAIGDESWFSYRHQSTHCYAKSRMEISPGTKRTIGTNSSGNYLFTEMQLLVLYVLRREQRFNQDYLLAITAP